MHRLGHLSLLVVVLLSGPTRAHALEPLCPRGAAGEVCRLTNAQSQLARQLALALRRLDQHERLLPDLLRTVDEARDLAAIAAARADALEASVGALQAERARVQAELAAQRADRAALQAAVAGLERRVRGLELGGPAAGGCADGGSPVCCPPGTAFCGGGCVDVAVDSQNCGACGTRCPGGARCVDGECGLPPPPPPERARLNCFCKDGAEVGTCAETDCFAEDRVRICTPLCLPHGGLHGMLPPACFEGGAECADPPPPPSLVTCACAYGVDSLCVAADCADGAWMGVCAEHCRGRGGESDAVPPFCEPRAPRCNPDGPPPVPTPRLIRCGCLDGSVQSECDAEPTCDGGEWVTHCDVLCRGRGGLGEGLPPTCLEDRAECRPR